MLGPPRSAIFAANGFEYQALRYGLLQWKPGEGRVVLANALEIMDRAGLTDWLYIARQVPRPIEDDGSTSFQHAVEIRTGWLTDDAIRSVFESNPDPIGRLVWTADHARDRWGLPMSRPERLGPFVAQRFQRGVLQHWIEEVEGLPAPGSVTTVLLDEVLRHAGLMPEAALASVDSAAAATQAAGNTLGDQLESAINARLASEPGNWAVYAAPSGSDAEVAINADTVVRAASLWKLVVLVEAFRQRAVIGLSFDTMLEMNQSVLDRVDPPASLAPGRRLTIANALERTMTFSDNSAAVLLGDRIGYANMQWTLGQLGLTATDVLTTHPVTTAREAAKLLEVALGMRPAHWSRTLDDVQGMRTLLLGESRDNRIPARLARGDGRGPQDRRPRRDFQRRRSRLRLDRSRHHRDPGARRARTRPRRGDVSRDRRHGRRRLRPPSCARFVTSGLKASANVQRGRVFVGSRSPPPVDCRRVNPRK